MSEPVIICGVAASGDVYAIFGGGLAIPDEYDGILYQGTRGLGRFGPGTYNAPIVLQSLGGYDGSESTLYYVRRDVFPVPVTIEGLPDPGSVNGRLAAHLTLDFQVVDPVVLLAKFLKGRDRADADEVVAIVRDDIRNLLDPIVACEMRQNLFTPSIFHETAILTLSDYINNSLIDRGLQLAGISSFRFEERAPASRDPISRPPSERYGHAPQRSPWADESPVPISPPPPAPPSAPPSAPPPAAPSRGGAPGAPASRQSRPAPPAPPSASPARRGAPQAAPPPASPSAATPGGTRTMAPGVATLRRKLAEALLGATWEDFAGAVDHAVRVQFLRDLDPEMVLSNEKIAELAQKLMPDQFDFRWATTFFCDQQCLFNAEQMRAFQRIIASLSIGRARDRNQAMLDTTGRAVPAAGGSGEMMMPPLEPEAAGAGADRRGAAEPQITSDGSLDVEAPGFPPAARSSEGRPRESAHHTPVGIVKERPNELYNEISSHRGSATPGAVPYVANPNARVNPGSTHGASEVKVRRYRDASESEEDIAFQADEVSLEELGEVEFMLNTTQTLLEKKASKWIVILSNKSSLNFSRVKVSVRAESLVSAGSGVINDFDVGMRRTLELRLSRTRNIRDSSFRITAIAYARGGALPYVFTATGTVKFRPSTFGNEHLVSVAPDAGGYKMMSSSEVHRYAADIAETQGPQINPDDMRLFPLRPDSGMTTRLRTSIPDANMGTCPICENDTPRKYGSCQVCGSVLPRWYNKQPVLLTPEYSNARAHVERARLWLEGETPEQGLFVVLGSSVLIGRRHDNDVVLRVHGANGKVDERRTTELSRVSATLDYSQGSIRFTCLNRHGVRYRGKLIACDQSIELSDDARLEFINRQGEPVLALNVRILYPSGSDETGGIIGPQAIMIEQENDPRQVRCLFLIRSATFGFVTQGGKQRMFVPGPAQGAPGRLIYHEECLWIEPATIAVARGERRGDLLELQSNQLMRVDADANIDFHPGALHMKVYHAKGMAQ